MFYRIKKNDKLFCMKIDGLADNAIELLRKNGYIVSPITREQAQRLIAALEVVNGADAEAAEDYAKEIE